MSLKPQILGGTKIINPAATEQLTETSSEIAAVLVQPRFNTGTGAALNTGVVEVGTKPGSTFCPYCRLTPNMAGVEIPCADPSDLYVRNYVNGDGITWEAIA